MLYMEDASKRQLLTIALWEDCPNDYKYQAVRELQLRQWHDDYLPDLVRLFGEGKSVFDISIELGVDYDAVDYRLTKLGLWGRRINRK